jgi:hypothetical protein
MRFEHKGVVVSGGGTGIGAGDRGALPQERRRRRRDGSARRAARSGRTGNRLRAVRDGHLWLSSRAWLEEYIRTRDPRGGPVPRRQVSKRPNGGRRRQQGDLFK